MRQKELNPDKDGDNAAEPVVDYTSLRYIRLRGDDSKLPAESWGGYDQDFAEAKHVHTHESVTAHPSEDWGIVDCESPDHTSLSLLIFDLDTHKAPDEFDPSRVDLPGDTLVTESQNGGFHVYFKVHKPRGELNESDFAVSDDLPFGIDIRGSAVSHHVVAPADIPGVGGAYEVVNNSPIQAVFGPEAAAERIELDGDPAITVDATSQSAEFDWDRPDEAPDDMPTCYHAGLSLRREAPEDHGHTHKVNVLTALCGLAAGYDAEDVAHHMCGEYAPQDGGADLSDQETTEYQVQHLHDKLESGQYAPPAVSTLRDYGILGADEFCDGDCQIGSHDLDPSEFAYDIDEWGWDEVDWETVRRMRELSSFRSSDDEVSVIDRHDAEEWVLSKNDEGVEQLDGLKVSEPIGPDDTVNVDLKPIGYAEKEHYGDAEETVRRKLGSLADRVIHCEPVYKLIYRLGELYDQKLNAQARSAAAHRLLQAMDFVTTGGADNQEIACYDPETGVYEDDGREVIRSVIEAVCPSRSIDNEKREIVAKVADRTRDNSAAAWEPRGEFADENHDYRVVGNGVLRLPTEQPDGSVCDPELLDFSPDLRARARVPTDYNPDADTGEVEEWLDGMTGREEDKKAIEELVGNVLLPDYKHPKISMLHGSGRNGKGVLLDVIAELCGGVESSNVAGNRLEDLVENNFRTAKLMDALVNVNGELNGRKLSENDASKLKELTGGEPQEGENKHIPAETFRNTAKLWFASNSPLLPPETKESWQERWVPVELPYSFVPNPDPDDEYQKPDEKGIKDRLTRDANLEAMLVLAVEGLARLEAQGDVSLPETPQERLDQYELDADPISRVEHDVIEAAEFGASKAEKYVPTGALYAAYKQLARDDGVEPTNRNKFFSILEDRCSEIPFDKSRPRTPDAVDSEREYALKGVRFRPGAAEYLSEYWMSHPWVLVDPDDEDDGDEVVTTSQSPRYESVTALADIHQENGYVAVDVIVVEKTHLHSNITEVTVTDGDSMRDITFKDRGDSKLVGMADDVQVGDRILVEKVKPDNGDLAVRSVTDVTVVERDGDGQESGESDDEGVPQSDRVTAIRNIIESEKMDDVEHGAKVDDVIELAESRGIAAEIAEDEVRKLLRQGELEQPAEGVVRLT